QGCLTPVPDPGDDIVEAALASDTLEQATCWRHSTTEAVGAFLQALPWSQADDFTDIGPVIAAVPGCGHAYPEGLSAIEQQWGAMLGVLDAHTEQCCLVCMMAWEEVAAPDQARLRLGHQVESEVTGPVDRAADGILGVGTDRNQGWLEPNLADRGEAIHFRSLSSDGGQQGIDVLHPRIPDRDVWNQHLPTVPLAAT